MHLIGKLKVHLNILPQHWYGNWSAFLENSFYIYFCILAISIILLSLYVALCGDFISTELFYFSDFERWNISSQNMEKTMW